MTHRGLLLPCLGTSEERRLAGRDDGTALRVEEPSRWWPQNKGIKLMADYILTQITWWHQRYFMMRRRMDALRPPRGSWLADGSGAAPRSLVLVPDRDR